MKNGNKYSANVKSVFNYYAFGMLMPSMYSTATPNYRFGFNGMIRDDDVKEKISTVSPMIEGTGNSYDFGARIYDPRVGRFLSLDPLMNRFPWQSPFVFAGNDPIRYNDKEGKLLWVPVIGSGIALGVGEGLVILGTATGATIWVSNGQAIKRKAYDILGQFTKEAPITDDRLKSELANQPKSAGDEGKPVFTMVMPKEEKEDYAYRGGSATNANFTPRDPTDLNSGLSLNIDPEEAAKRATSDKAQKIDLNQLRNSGLNVIKSPDGHVSVKPYNQEEMKKWAESREKMKKMDPKGNSGNSNTEAVKRAKVEEVKTNNYKKD